MQNYPIYIVQYNLKNLMGLCFQPQSKLYNEANAAYTQIAQRMGRPGVHLWLIPTCPRHGLRSYRMLCQRRR